MKQDTKKEITSITELQDGKLHTVIIRSMKDFLNIIAEALDIKPKDTATINMVELQKTLYDNIIKRFYKFCRETAKVIEFNYTKLKAIDGFMDFFKQLAKTNKELSFFIFMAFDNLNPKAKKISNQTQGHLSHNNIWQKAKTLPLGASLEIPCLEDQKKVIVKSLLSHEREGFFYSPDDRTVESVCKKLSFHHIMPKSHVMRFLAKLSKDEKDKLKTDHMMFFNYNRIHNENKELLDGLFDPTNKPDISLKISLMLFAKNMFLGPNNRNDDPGDGCDCPTDDIKSILATIYGCDIRDLGDESKQFLRKRHEISQSQKEAFLAYFSDSSQTDDKPYELNTKTKWSRTEGKYHLNDKGKSFSDVVLDIAPTSTNSNYNQHTVESNASPSNTTLRVKKRGGYLWKRAKNEKLAGEISLINIKNEYVKDIITKIGIVANDDLISLFSNKLAFHHKIPKAFIQKNLDKREDEIIAALLNPINMFLGPLPNQRLNDPKYAADYNYSYSTEERTRSLSESSSILQKILPSNLDENAKSTEELLKQKQIEIYTKNDSSGFKTRLLKTLKIKFEEDELQADTEESKVDSLNDLVPKNKDEDMTKQLREMVRNKSLLWEVVGSAFKKAKGATGYIAVPIVQKSPRARIGMNIEEYIYFMAWIDFQQNNYREDLKGIYETMANEFVKKYYEVKENRTLFDPKLLGIENFPPSTSLNHNKAINSLVSQNTKPPTSGDDSKKTNASTMSTKKLSLHS